MGNSLPESGLGFWKGAETFQLQIIGLNARKKIHKIMNSSLHGVSNPLVENNNNNNNNLDGELSF